MLFNLREYTNEDLKAFIQFQKVIEKESTYLKAVNEETFNGLGKGKRFKIFLSLNNKKEIIGSVVINPDIKKSIYISSVVTLAKHQRRGIASGLLCMLEEYAVSKNIKTLWLIVDNDNIAAIKLYVKHGFIADEVDPKYDDGTVTMYKDLKNKPTNKLN